MASNLPLEAGPLARQTGWLAHYRPGLRLTERGYVLSVGDGIPWIHGLPSAAQQVHLSKVLQIQAERLVRDKVLARIQALQPVTVEALKTRYHGDYQLGQVLVAKNDFILVDFEGEPGRTLEERRHKHSPLRDVAKRLRSVNYAAYIALPQATKEQSASIALLAPFARNWELQTREVFLAG